MNNEAVSRYFSPVPPLTPIYIETNLFATLQKEGRVAQYISVYSRPVEKSLLESCVSIVTVNHFPLAYPGNVVATSSIADSNINTSKHVSIYNNFASNDIGLTEGWEIITSMNSSSSAYLAPAEPKLSTANNLVNFSKNTAVNSRSSEISGLESYGSIATVYHSPPAYQESAKATSSVVSNVVNTTKRVNIFDRITLDLDARVSKSDLKLKAEKAANDFLDAMAPDSQTDADTAVERYDTSMREISAMLDKFKTSTLVPGIKKEIIASFNKMAVEKFSDSGSSVNSATVEKVKTILELANQSTVGQPDSTTAFGCKTIANQVLKVFQEQLFKNLKIQTKKITNDLLAAAEPGSKIPVAEASKVFDKKMKIISEQRELLKGHDLYKDFACKIRKASNSKCRDIYSIDKKKNMADWKGKSRKLAEENGAFLDETYPKDMWSSQEILVDQLRWMKEEDFSNQIKASIKEVFPKRYEFIVSKDIKEAKGIINVTAFSIERFKESLREKCIAKNDLEIAKNIQENRKELAKLLMADDSREIFVSKGPKAVMGAINKYLENNETELDLAVGGMILDHIKKMQLSGLLHDM